MKYYWEKLKSKLGNFSVDLSFLSGLFRRDLSMQETMFRVDLARKSVSLFRGFGLLVMFFATSIGITGLYLFPEQQAQAALYWSWATVIGIVILIALGSLSQWAKRWFNWIFLIWYGGFSFVSGYYLVQLSGANYSVTYFIYLLPFITIISTGDFKLRSVTALGSLLALAGIMHTGGMGREQLIVTSVILAGSILLSVVLGHYYFFNLHRELFRHYRGRGNVVQSSEDQFFNYDQEFNSLISMARDTGGEQVEVIGLLGDESPGGCVGLFYRRQFPGELGDRVVVKSESLEAQASEIVWVKELGQRYRKVGFEFEQS